MAYTWICLVLGGPVKCKSTNLSEETVFVIKCLKLIRNSKCSILGQIRKERSDLLSQWILAVMFVQSPRLLK